MWVNGVSLIAGHRDAVTDRGDGWVLTQPFQDDTILLNKFALGDGSTAGAYVLDKGVQGLSGAGITADGAGGLWITYLLRVVHFDEATGKVTTWSLPSVTPRLASDNPLAGNAQANAWDPSNNKLLYVRNDDQRLFAFDPLTGTSDVISDLPITTSSISMIAVASDGEVAVTGSLAAAQVFTPTAISLSSLGAKPELMNAVSALCVGSAGLASLSSTGAISIGVNNHVAMLAALRGSRVPFACDGNGNVFEAAVGGGQVVVSRVSASGAVSVVNAPLVPGVVNGLNGPLNTYANPGIVALLSDGQSGAWLVSEVGAQASTRATAIYPSLAHVVYPP
jgi:hypothetical protein